MHEKDIWINKEGFIGRILGKITWKQREYSSITKSIKGDNFMQKAIQHSAQKAAFPNLIWKCKIKIWKGRIKCDSCHAFWLIKLFALKMVMQLDMLSIKVKFNNPAINLPNNMVSNEDGHAVWKFRIWMKSFKRQI